MPISVKILQKINELNETKEFKALMMSILEQEDRGSHQYKRDYIKMVNDYLAKKEKTDR